MNQKKTIIILIFILLVGIVGLTIAYFSNTTSINNLFSTNPYGTTVEEVFVSPDNWLPGTTTDKEITVTNSGSVDEAVRISYSETWKAKDNTILSGLIDQDGNLTSTEENSEHAAIINFSDNGDFTYSNGYYYYNYRLAPNETTSSLIDSVTFNSKVKNSSNCITNTNNGVKTITCNSTQSGYDGATYTLTFTIETVQYDKYKQAWGVDVAILNEQSLFCDYFDSGEIVTYNGSEYYVLKDSSISDEYVTLLKKETLTASEVNQYSTSYVSQNGEYPYYESDTCNENIQTGCSTNYDTSDVKKIIDGWSSSFSDDLVEIDGYKTRLIGENDINFEYYEGISDSGYGLSSDTPNFIRNSNNMYWINLISGDLLYQVYKINYGLEAANIYDKVYIRPIINVKKSAINGACYINNSNQYLTCNRGEVVKYNNNDYYVIKNSDNNNKFVDLIKVESLTAEEVNQYSTNYVSQDGEYSYKFNYPFDVKYEESDIKIIVDKWALENVDSTVKTKILDETAFENMENPTQVDIDFLKKIYSGKEYWSIKTVNPISDNSIGVSTHLS